MSDLISRSATIRTMWDRYNSEYNDASKYDEDETKLANKIIADMQRIVEAEPTAYDVEKVVDALRIDCYQIGLDESMTEILVEDVRKGGVNERD